MLIYLCYIVTLTYIAFHIFIFQVIATFAAFAPEKLSKSGPFQIFSHLQWISTDKATDRYGPQKYLLSLSKFGVFFFFS